MRTKSNVNTKAKFERDFEYCNRIFLEETSIEEYLRKLYDMPEGDVTNLHRNKVVYAPFSIAYKVFLIEFTTDPKLDKENIINLPRKPTFNYVKPYYLEKRFDDRFAYLWIDDDEWEETLNQFNEQLKEANDNESKSKLREEMVKKYNEFKKNNAKGNKNALTYDDTKYARATVENETVNSAPKPPRTTAPKPKPKLDLSSSVSASTPEEIAIKAKKLNIGGKVHIEKIDSKEANNDKEYARGLIEGIESDNRVTSSERYLYAKALEILNHDVSDIPNPHAIAGKETRDMLQTNPPNRFVPWRRKNPWNMK